MARVNIFDMSFSKIYDAYVKKIERKGRVVEELDEIIYWLTGYNKDLIQENINNNITLKEFFINAPKLNNNRFKVKGKICGVDISLIEDPLMKEVRILDKLVDELSKGKEMSKILKYD